MPEFDGLCCALQASSESGFWCASNHIGFDSDWWLVTSSMYKLYTIIHDIGINIQMTSEGKI